MPTLRGTGGQVSGNNPGSITLVNSTTPLSGDVIRCFIHQNPNATGVYGTITPPSGFALDTDGTTTATIQKSDWSKLTCWKKVAGGSETNSYQFSFGSSMDGAAGVIIVHSGEDTASTGTVVTQDDTGSNTAFTIPSITTKRNASDVIVAISNGGNGTYSGITAFASAWTNSYVEFRDICILGEWAGVATATQTKATAGAVGTAQATSAAADTSLAIVIEVWATAVATLSAATPSGTLGTSTTATLGCTTDVSSGTLYGVVDVAANISGITAAQVKAAQNNASAAPVASGNSSVSTSSPSIGITGLAASTLYSYALVQNSAGGDSNVLTGTFTTAAVAITADCRKFGPQGFLTTLLTM